MVNPVVPAGRVYLPRPSARPNAVAWGQETLPITIEELSVGRSWISVWAFDALVKGIKYSQRHPALPDDDDPFLLSVSNPLLQVGCREAWIYSGLIASPLDRAFCHIRKMASWRLPLQNLYSF